MGIVSQQRPKYLGLLVGHSIEAFGYMIHQPTLPSEFPGRVKIAIVRIIAIARRLLWTACIEFLVLLW